MTTEKPRAKQIGTAIPKSILIVLNQLYEIEQKLPKPPDPSILRRNIDKMKDAFAEEGLPIHDAGGRPCIVSLKYEDPMDQSYNDTRTDLKAEISGDGKENLVVVKVIKPIIRVTWKDGADVISKIVQQGIVIVASRKEQVEP